MRKLALALVSLLGCSRATDDAGLVLNVDVDATVVRSAITALAVTVDGKTNTWVLSQPLPGSLGIVTSAGSKMVLVDGLANTTVLGRWSGTVVVDKGKVVTKDVLLGCVACGASDAAVPPIDSNVTGTGGKLGTGGATGIDGGRSDVGTGGVSASGGAVAFDGAAGAGGATGTGGTGALDAGADLPRDVALIGDAPGIDVPGSGGLATTGGATGTGGAGTGGAGTGGAGTGGVTTSGGTGAGGTGTGGIAIDAGGPFNRAVEVDGNQFSHVNVGNVTIPADFTLELWTKVAPAQPAGSDHMMIVKDTSFVVENQFRVFLWYGYLIFMMSDPSGQNGGLFDGTTWALRTAEPVPTGVWLHLAITKKGATFVLYLGGVPQTTVTTTLNLWHASTAPMRFGGRDSADDTWFRGAFDEVRLWRVARSAAEIQADMARPIASTRADFASLVGYWQLDEGVGTTTADARGAWNGALSSVSWLTSGAPLQY